MTTSNIIPNLFRTEYSKLVAVLCKAFGLAHIQVAEDIVSDTFLLAADTWGKKGVPDNQVAWLYTVAKNRTRDYLRREKVRREKIEPALQHQQAQSYDMNLNLDFSAKNITDSQLRMMFAICHPILKPEAQIILALRILCGFGIEEISSAMLSNKPTINKRLYRAKESLRKNHIKLDFPEKTNIKKRLDTVLTTLYLLFNEGYYSTTNEKTLRKFFCLEAIRLNLLLVQYPPTNLPKVNALLSLMCFHASRFEARYQEDGGFVLYQNQNKARWNLELIERGEYFLNQAARGEALNKYHLEAAIAYWHTQEDSLEKWEQILQLYNYLLQVNYSSMAALNRTYAYARAGHQKEALKAALKLDLKNNHLYHCLLAELYQPSDKDKEIVHLKIALKLSKSKQEKDFILKKLSD